MHKPPPRAVAKSQNGLAARQPQPRPPIAACRNPLIFMVKNLLRTSVLALGSDFDSRLGAARTRRRAGRKSTRAADRDHGADRRSVADCRAGLCLVAAPDRCRPD